MELNISFAHFETLKLGGRADIGVSSLTQEKNGEVIFVSSARRSQFELLLTILLCIENSRLQRLSAWSLPPRRMRFG